MDRRILLIISSFLLCFQLSAQVVPVQNQFVVNPFIYNPAWAGSSDYVHLHAGFKTQWLGIDGAPMIGTLTFEAPLNDALSLGANIVNVNEGPWNYLDAKFGAAYKLALGWEENHFLSFGMSLGIRYNSFNLAKLDDPNDPALTDLSNGNVTADGSFGLAYQFDNLNVGLSMPRFNEVLPGTGEFDVRPWQHIIATASYRFDLGYAQEWALIPTFIYHREQEISDQFEGALRTIYQDKYSLGASYRQDLGLSAFAGVEINDLVGINYFYTFGNVSSPVSNQSHELVVSFKIGGKKRGVVQSTTETISENTEEGFESNGYNGSSPASSGDNPIFNVDAGVTLDRYDASREVHVALDTKATTGRTPDGSTFDLEKGNYISMGKYKYTVYAEPLVKKMKEKGLNPKYVYVADEPAYYVYILQKAETDLDLTRKIVVSLRKLKGFEKAHLLVLE